MFSINGNSEAIGEEISMFSQFWSQYFDVKRPFDKCVRMTGRLRKCENEIHGEHWQITMTVSVVSSFGKLCESPAGLRL